MRNGTKYLDDLQKVIMENNKPIKFTKREKDVISLAKKGYSYKEMAEYHGATYYAINSIMKGLYKKLGVTSMPRMLAKLKKIQDSMPIEEAAREEWSKEEMYGSERDYEYFLQGFKLASKRYR